MREGYILCLEEIDAATPEIRFVLQGVLEEGGALTIAGNAGEHILPVPQCPPVSRPDRPPNRIRKLTQMCN